VPTLLSINLELQGRGEMEDITQKTYNSQDDKYLLMFLRSNRAFEDYASGCNRPFA
jgi:hypothetical protein